MLPGVGLGGPALRRAACARARPPMREPERSLQRGASWGRGRWHRTGAAPQRLSALATTAVLHPLPDHGIAQRCRRSADTATRPPPSSCGTAATASPRPTSRRHTPAGPPGRGCCYRQRYN
eukprot:504389-Pleurochrysis_carterae.AAC.1